MQIPGLTLSSRPLGNPVLKTIRTSTEGWLLELCSGFHTQAHMYTGTHMSMHAHTHRKDEHPSPLALGKPLNIFWSRG